MPQSDTKRGACELMTPDSTDTCAPIIFRDRADFDARVEFQRRLMHERDHTLRNRPPRSWYDGKEEDLFATEQEQRVGSGPPSRAAKAPPHGRVLRKGK